MRSIAVMDILTQYIIQFRQHQAEWFGLFAFVFGAQGAFAFARAFAQRHVGKERTVTTIGVAATRWSHALMFGALAATFGALAFIVSHARHGG